MARRLAAVCQFHCSDCPQAPTMYTRSFTHTHTHIHTPTSSWQSNVKVFLSESNKCLESLCPALYQSINPHTFSFNLGVTSIQPKIANPRWCLFNLTHSILLWLMTSPPQESLDHSVPTTAHALVIRHRNLLIKTISKHRFVITSICFTLINICMGAN